MRLKNVTSKSCLACNLKKPFEEIYEKKMTVFNTPVDLVEDLKRSTDLKIRAHSKGVIRPFLLLVAMGPRMRNQISNMLGYTLIKKPFFGDSHAEALDIIEHKTKGLIDCCSGISKTVYERLQKREKAKGFTWYQMLHLCSTSGYKTIAQKKLGYKKSYQMCCEPSLVAPVRELENEMIRNVAKEYIVKGQKLQIELINAWWAERNNYSEALERLRKVGLEDETTQKYCLTIYLAFLSLRNTEDKSPIDIKGQLFCSLICKVIALSISAPLALVIGIVWTINDVMQYCFGRCETKVLGPLLLILNQRIALDAMGISIDDYYCDRLLS